jgi:endonuclease YncB( thermonuclease family)
VENPSFQPAPYDDLREQVQGLIAENRHDAAMADETDKLHTYWQIGDALYRHLEGQTESTQVRQTVSKLSKDIDIGQATLYDILRWRRLLAVFYARRNLGWTHYRILVRLPDIEQLRYYEEQASEGAWSTRQLRQVIDTDTDGLAFAPTDESEGTPFRASFGALSTHRVIHNPWDDAGAAIDLGFHQVWAPDDLPGFEEASPGDHVSLVEVEGQLQARLRKDRPGLWTYPARVGRIVDGDTLTAIVALGESRFAFPRLRLRGIDTPELDTHAGRRAKDAVNEWLAEATTIVIRTQRTDAYGRYLADVKYLPGESDPAIVLSEGIYLNRELLDEGLARRYVG